MNDKCVNCILAVDAGGTYLKSALVRPDFTLIENSFLKIPVDSQGELESIRESYTRLASLGAREASKRGLVLSRIGVCIPGPFDYANGTCLMKHKYLSIYGVPMRPWFEEGAGNIPVHFVHDSTAFILGATIPERYSSFKRIGAVIIGTGLGFATMVDSRVFKNPQGGPGISIFSRPYKDSTAEEYVSRRAIISHYRKLYPDAEDTIDVIDIVNLARSGQHEAVRAFNDTGVYLSEIIRGIISDNNYECLLLGGAISKSADLFMPALKKGLSGLPALALIEPADDIDNAPLLGAAKAAMDLI